MRTFDLVLCLIMALAFWLSTIMTNASPVPESSPIIELNLGGWKVSLTHQNSEPAPETSADLDSMESNGIDTGDLSSQTDPLTQGRDEFELRQSNEDELRKAKKRSHHNRSRPRFG